MAEQEDHYCGPYCWSCNPSMRRQRRWEEIREAVLCLGIALLAIVVLFAGVWFLGERNRSGDLDTDRTAHECRYDPRFGDDC